MKRNSYIFPYIFLSASNYRILSDALSVLTFIRLTIFSTDTILSVMFFFLSFHGRQSNQIESRKKFKDFYETALFNASIMLSMYDILSVENGMSERASE